METFDPDAGSEACLFNRRANRETTDQPPWPGPLLLWQQAGPNGDGDTTIESSFAIANGDYEGVCALITLRDNSDRRAVAYLRLVNLPVETATTSTTNP